MIFWWMFFLDGVSSWEPHPLTNGWKKKQIHPEHFVGTGRGENCFVSQKYKDAEFGSTLGFVQDFFF